ncbi:MAG: T9SS type A sorting domain-containing protein [Bacteroidetes bacterium]|nr:T9SS type A sorting domain-containing protein [Bacteroidota bacterium]
MKKKSTKKSTSDGVRYSSESSDLSPTGGIRILIAFFFPLLVGGGLWGGASCFAQTLAGGQAHSIALCSGCVWTWGNNFYGQLGNNSATDRYAPVQAMISCDVKSVSAGDDHSIALKTDETVWTWGLNDRGQLGDGTTANKKIPVQVSGLTGVLAIAGGWNHSIAVKTDGSVWPWGWNTNGQLGDGTTTQSLTPVQVSGLAGITAVGAGGGFSVALKNDGTVWTWGYNGDGNLGDGTATQHLTPVQVLAGASGCATYLCDIIAIDVMDRSVFAVRNDGTVWAWGWNGNGQLGDGTTITKLTPVQVSGLAGITAVSAGSGFSVALKNDSTVWAWGGNIYGQLGDGTTTQQLTPVQVVGTGGVGFLTGITDIGTGMYHAYAGKSDGTLWAWGASALGNNTATASSTPVQPIGLCPAIPTAVEPFFREAGIFELISIYPNPSTEGSIQYTVASEEGGEVSVKVYDIIGRKVLSNTETLEGGVVTKKLSTAGLSSGSYLLQVTNNNLEKTQKQFVIR